MATSPNSSSEAPRAEDPSASDIAPVPDQDGPHDVPDDEVIEHTLPKRDSSRDSPRPR